MKAPRNTNEQLVTLTFREGVVQLYESEIRCAWVERMGAFCLRVFWDFEDCDVMLGLNNRDEMFADFLSEWELRKLPKGPNDKEKPPTEVPPTELEWVKRWVVSQRKVSCTLIKKFSKSASGSIIRHEDKLKLQLPTSRTLGGPLPAAFNNPEVVTAVREIWLGYTYECIIEGKQPTVDDFMNSREAQLDTVYGKMVELKLWEPPDPNPEPGEYNFSYLSWQLPIKTLVCILADAWAKVDVAKHKPAIIPKGQSIYLHTHQARHFKELKEGLKNPKLYRHYCEVVNPSWNGKGTDPLTAGIGRALNKVFTWINKMKNQAPKGDSDAGSNDAPPRGYPQDPNPSDLS